MGSAQADCSPHLAGQLGTHTSRGPRRAWSTGWWQAQRSPCCVPVGCAAPCELPLMLLSVPFLQPLRWLLTASLGPSTARRATGPRPATPQGACCCGERLRGASFPDFTSGLTVTSGFTLQFLNSTEHSRWQIRCLLPCSALHTFQAGGRETALWAEQPGEKFWSRLLVCPWESGVMVGGTAATLWL